MSAERSAGRSVLRAAKRIRGVVVRVVLAVVARVVVRVAIDVTRFSTAPRNFARACSSWSSAVCAAWRLVTSAAITKRTPEARCATTAASVTASTGGVSMITQSKWPLSELVRSAKRLRAEKLRRVWRRLAGRHDPQVLDAARVNRPRSAWPRRPEGSRGPARRRRSNSSCASRAPHVGVDEQHALPCLGEADRHVPGDHRLAFARAGAGHDDRPRAAIRGGEQDVGPQAAERLGEVRRRRCR